MTGYPMDKPNRYSDKIALAKFESLKTDMPREMYEVIIEGKPFTDQPRGRYADISCVGLKIDKTIKLLLVADNATVSWLLSESSNADIRGYYFLSIEPDLSTKLADYKKLPAKDHDRLEQWLVLFASTI